MPGSNESLLLWLAVESIALDDMSVPLLRTGRVMHAPWQGRLSRLGMNRVLRVCEVAALAGQLALISSGRLLRAVKRFSILLVAGGAIDRVSNTGHPGKR